MLESLAVEIQEKIKNQFIKVLIAMNSVIRGVKTKLQGLNQTIAQVRFFDR